METSGASSPIDVFEAMGTARAMRWFLPDPVPDSMVDQLLWAATRASSPSNTQPWHFVVVREPEARARVGACFAELAAQREASAGAVESPPLDPTTRRMHEGAFNLMRTMGEVPVLIFVCGTNRYPEGAPNIALMHSAVYAAAQNMVVAARALGLGAAFTTLHVFVEPQIRELLAIPADVEIAVTLPLGWPARPFGPMTRRPISDVVHYDRW